MEKTNTTNYLSTTFAELYQWFDKLNVRFFKGELTRPMITIQTGKKSEELGWFLSLPWVSNTDQTDNHYEINIVPKAFQIVDDNDLVELVAVLLHEMVHYDNYTHGVKDTTANGKKHNKKFLKSAEAVGLIVEEGKTVGYGYTTASETLKEYIINELKPNKDALVYYQPPVVKEPKPKKPRRKVQYTCENCGTQFMLKDEYNLMCGVCKNAFKTEEIVEE